MSLETSSAAVQTLARLAALAPAAARRELLDLVLKMVNEFLGRPAGDLVGPRERLIAAGFDSLRALDFSVELERRFLCELRPTLVFDYPTPEAVAAHLAERVLNLPLERTEVSLDAADEGLAEELERASSLSEDELRLLLARTRHRLRSLERASTQPIAIVGMACRFPGGVDSPEALWHLLDNGRSAIAEVEEARWPISQLYHPDRTAPGRINTRQAGMLDNITDFDARFFNISPKEANDLDPQQRLLLEVSWEALERANIPVAKLYGRSVGVFVGIKASEYFDSLKSGLPEESGTYRATGNSLSTAAGRISYTFGFTGPCFPVDTACSSSLVALHLAVQSLRRGECSVALAGGANVLIDPHISIGLSKANMLSSDGRCKTFDASADGYVRAEGCGMLVLKPLSRALADGDRVHAVVRGTAINQDGASGGLTVPSGPGQETVVRAALADAQVKPWEVGFVETHGTGTALGDPIEITALDNVFGGDQRFHGQPLIVGAGKTNHGHMECAAGVASIIKTVLAIENERIPKNLHFESPNPRIPWEHTVVKVAAEPIEWRRGSAPRIAGVSSFGFSGTNAHAVLEEPPQRRRAKRRALREGGELVPLSARVEADLARLANSYADHLESGRFDLADVAFTAAIGRSHFPFRAAIIAEDGPSLISGLRALAEGRSAAGLLQGSAAPAEPGIAFLFSGQGAQRAGMGSHLYQSELVFRDTIDRCAVVLDERLGIPLVELLWGRHTDRIDDTRYTQPGMVAFQLALASLWESWGIRPRWVLGHSIGEVSAACSAGVLSLEQALILAEARGRLMDGLEERGIMVSVSIAPDEAERLVAEHGSSVCVAAYNGPQAVVLAGRSDDVGALGEALQARGVRVVPLRVSHAFHSSLMDPMLAAFRSVTTQIRANAATRDWVSTVTPDRSASDDADYWLRNVREPVRFTEGMQQLATAGCRVFLEIGPSGTLLAMGRSCVNVEGASWIPSQQAETHGRSRALTALGQLYIAGVEPSWDGLHAADTPPQRVDLPTYPFTRRTYWMQRMEGPLVRGSAVHPLLGVQLPLPPLAGEETVYSNQLSERSPAWLVDHRIGDNAVFPAAGYLEAGFALASLKPAAAVVWDLKISVALVLDERSRQVATVARDTPEGVQVEVKSRVQGGAWTTHATWTQGLAETEPQPANLAELLARCKEEIALEAVYEGYAERGLNYGEAFRGLRRVLLGDREVVAQVSLPSALNDQGYLVHPAVLDACFQAGGILVHDRDDMLLPIGVGRAVLYRSTSDTEIWCHARIASEGDDFVVLDLLLLDPQGRPCVKVQALRLVTTRAFRSTGKAENLLYSTKWERVDDLAVTAAKKPDEDAGSWLVLADRGTVADELVWLLDEHGAQVTVLRRDQVDTEDPEALDEVLAELEGTCSEIVYLWPLDDAEVPDVGDVAGHERALRGLLAIVQGALRKADQPPRLTIITRGAQQIGDSTDPIALTQAPLWGFAAALARELPATECRCIDLSTGVQQRDASTIFHELWHADGERRLAYRDGRRYAARLISGLGIPTRLVVPPGPGFELRTSGYGTLQNLGLRPITPRPPEPGEVLVLVEAAALNFKDVLHAMGVLQEFSARRGIHRAADQPLGLECTGRITALGAGVDHLRIGDEVLALTDGSMASHVTLSSTRVGPRPEGWQAHEAAGLQTVFFTAAYGLLVLARLCPGDRVLIHAAAGGVGQAAVQICKWIGAELYVTASQAKWSHLHDQGVERVMNSRAFDYSDEILRMTEGRGVDVVLNSLNEEHIPRSLAALAVGGRFVEIGKVGIWEPARVAEARPDVAYYTFDLGEVLAERPHIYSELLALLSSGFSSGKLRPVPSTVFPLSDGISAFQLLSSGKTIGKVVLAMPSAGGSDTHEAVKVNRSYIISGGLGALGLKTATWLSCRGAGALVLLGRRPPSPEAATAIDSIRDAGSKVYVVQVDIAEPGALERALEPLMREIPPVGGIVHAAGVLEDGLVQGIDWDRCWTVMAPKVAGGWHLHRWSLDRNLDWFVSYASIASVIGSAGQTSYAAANAFLEALAHERRRLGLPGTSVHWGSWSGGGMAHDQSSVMRKRMRRLGLRELRAEDALDMLEVVLRADTPQAVIASVKWDTYTRSLPGDPFFNALGSTPGKARSVDGGGFRTTLLTAPPEERTRLLLEFAQRHLAAVVGLKDPSEITSDTSFAELGVDSLLALDLRTVLEQGLQAILSTTMIFDHPTVESLVSYLNGLVPRSETFGQETT